MKREHPRPRRYVSPTLLKLATPFVRYSISRDAFILRGVGKHMGPVMVSDHWRADNHVQVRNTLVTTSAPVTEEDQRGSR